MKSHTFDPRTLKAEAGGFLKIQGQMVYRATSICVCTGMCVHRFAQNTEIEFFPLSAPR